MENTTAPLALVHSTTTVPQEVAYRNLLDAIYAPTRYSVKRPKRHLSAVN